MDTAHIQITPAPVGARVRVNGDDLTNRIAALNIRAGATEPTVLTLHLLAGADGSCIEGRGVVHVADGADPGQVVVEFLARVDPGELEQAALMAEGAGSLTEKMIAVLADWAAP